MRHPKSLLEYCLIKERIFLGLVFELFEMVHIVHEMEVGFYSRSI